FIVIVAIRIMTSADFRPSALSYTFILGRCDGAHIQNQTKCKEQDKEFSHWSSPFELLSDMESHTEKEEAFSVLPGNPTFVCPCLRGVNRESPRHKHTMSYHWKRRKDGPSADRVLS